MKYIKLPILTLISLSLSALSAAAQTPNDTEDVVKITTKLVQVDVVVTDKSGKQVRDLKPADFELTQDGKRQEISAATFVSPRAGAALSPVINDLRSGRKNTSGPAATRSVNAGGRLIAFLVDDGSCSATSWGMDVAKDAVSAFIREKMQPDDLVAIYRTRAGSSTLQQYTSDRTSLLRAAEKIRWYPPQGSCSVSDGSETEASRANTFAKPTSEGVQSVTIETDNERQRREYNEDWNAGNQIVGTLGVMRYAISGLAKSPGRKTMFVLSDGIAIRDRLNRRSNAREVMRDVTESANRAAVVIHTFDLRAGGNPGMIEARDQVSVQDNITATDTLVRGRIADAGRLQEGLSVLADETGGDVYRGTDSSENKMASILEQESGYYLIAYEPEEGSFKGKNFNEIDVKVTRADLKVRHRSGFMGIADASANGTKPARKSEYSDLYASIASPLPTPGLSLGLMASFGNSAAAGSFVRSVIHLEGSDITFVDDSNGTKKAVLDVVAVTLNEKNEVIDEFTRTHTIKFDAQTAAKINKDGLDYTTDVPIKKTGSYNFRVAVRDANSKLIGTVGQAVDIPDLKRSDVLVSGLTVSGVDANGKFETVGPTTAETAISLPSSVSAPSLRQFRPGSIVAYAYTLYNPRTDKATGRPKVGITVNLYRDGKLVAPGTETPAQFEDQPDWTRIKDYGYVRLNAQSAPGEYALQLIVRDLLGGKNSVSSQWIDLQVVN